MSGNSGIPNRKPRKAKKMRNRTQPKRPKFVRRSVNYAIRPFGNRPRSNPYLSRGNRYNNFGNLPVQVAPRTMSNRFNTNTSFTKDGVIAIIQLNTTILGNGTIAIPAHPLFYIGRIFDFAKNFTQFSVRKSALHYCPIKGTDEGGNLIITGQPRSTPVSQDPLTYVSILTQIGATITPVWSPTEYKMPNDNTTYPILPLKPSDIPYNYFLAIKDGEGNHAVSYYGDVYLQMDFKFSGNSVHDLTSVATPLIYTLAAGGVTTSANSTGETKIVVSYSTVPNIDVGEFVIIPPITNFGVATALNITHNAQAINYASVNDQGTVQGYSYIEN